MTRSDLERLLASPQRLLRRAIGRLISLPGIPGAIARTERHARQRSVRLVRAAPDADWKRRLAWRIYFARLAEDASAALLGVRPAKYDVRQRQPTLTNPRPRVLHVIPNLFVGGSTQLVVDLCEHLGHRLEMHVVTAALPPGGKHRGMSIRVLPLDAEQGAFEELLDEIRPDLVHVHYWGDVDLSWYERAFAAAFASDAKIIENVNTPTAPFLHPRIASYVAVSEYVRATYFPPLSNAAVIYPGIDLERFRAADASDADRFDSLGMVYRLHTDKLDERSIEPLLIVARRRPKTRVFVVGDGALFNLFHTRVRGEGLAHNFVFTGEVKFGQLADLYRSFCIFVAPVVRESFGQVTPMAMAMGCAVAGYRVGALAEILGSDQTLAETAEDLANIIICLLDDHDRVKALGERNQSRARLYDLQIMIARYAELYGETLGNSLDPMPGFPAPALFFGV